ncbi:MAG: DUF1080 domain-containing protein [Chitinophagaceae bacterium]|nr:DUF1080 domain-containing protein [Chitinophagaceae bacterium]
MKSSNFFFFLLTVLISCAGTKSVKSDGWLSLFDGKSLTEWKVGENGQTFTVDSGMIKVNGKRAHLFYAGNVNNHDFKNFHFKTEVLTTPGSNSGIYFHSHFQETGWPSTGFEIQVNNSHTDWRRTGSLYAIRDVKETFVKDNEWYTQEIMVVGKSITVKLNGNTVMEYTEPENVQGNKRIANGTFVLQGHDPNSKVYYRNIMVKPLPE